MPSFLTPKFHNQPTKVTLKFTIYHRNILWQQSIKSRLTFYPDF
jgi:hypothetical protein